MSCFNCYSSRKVDADLVDKILDRGHRLRSAMVQSILNNDPFNPDVIYSQERKAVKLDELPPDTNDKIKAFLQGDPMSREDEVSTLETLRSMSAVDLCKATDRTYRSEDPCDCLTCFEYKEKDLNCDLKRVDANNEITQKIQERYKSEAGNYLKFVDSVKISVNSVVLNEAGDRKVLGSLAKDKAAGVGQTFFLEYQLPEVLAKNHQKNKAKIDSGRDFGNIVRLCSRRSHQQAITFKQTSIHDLGGLKISVQLGCGRLYFGKEFIDAITNNKENSMVLGSDDLSSCGSDIVDKMSEFYSPKTAQQIPSIQKLVPQRTKTQAFGSLVSKTRKPEPAVRKYEPVVRKHEPFIRKPEPVNRKPEPVAEKPKPPLQSSKTVLFGFVYVSEAQLSREVMNSYLTCQLFAQDDVSTSNLVAFDSDPVYNFCQQIPLVYEEELLFKLRENFMVVEFFEKGQPKDFLIGISKLPLHQFYLAYRNPVVVKYLSERKFPVIGTDGWESVFNPNDGEVVGQAHILVALGTKEQIDHLESERGFKNSIVKAKTAPIFKTADVGVQSNMEPKENIEALLKQLVAKKEEHSVRMENSTNTEPVRDTTTNTEPEVRTSANISPETRISPNVSETRTSPSTIPEVRSTSDLLNSLQKALSIDNIKEKSFFKAHVAINSALHLPSRRKCKSKRSKGRNGKSEDILPSTYVSFEGHKGDLKITPIVPKSTNPKWDFRCDVGLPLEYLTDNQKFLVFKVWRKSTNTTMTPNMQTDHVIGFATVDLTVLSAGLPSIQGWFNINDLSKKCNGQINVISVVSPQPDTRVFVLQIHVTPLENVTQYKSEKCCSGHPTTSAEPPDPTCEPNELLGRALKRKFTELDEITQRLRLRLSKVTNDESDTSNDEIADEFERDINTLCVEDDFDMVDFEEEAHVFNVNREVGLLRTDQMLVEGKQKIDQLLEKLSLMSGENSSRYVSGCSDVRLDTEAIFNELDSGSRPNLYSSASFSREMEQKFGSFGNSESSSVGSERRAGPEGEGHVTEAKAND
ncbi:hypothetical protein GEV33_004773 [Tenebrio molitor]|uniref:C2 domain-containing protein n=1 Tax=Tenebrio molitor TaxID=7067 RepID=A0A8J6LFD3_TENMO|nr:hypothetical protein GEV33_004773 [Tenebrio molitor]